MGRTQKISMELNSKNEESLHKVTMEEYLVQPEKFELRSGKSPNAPTCPYGNYYEWIGYDLEKEEYIRFTKSVFKKLTFFDKSRGQC